MENRIRQHIESLFSSAPNTARARELREEMILNVIERYHDLVQGGKSEEDAYRIAISGIGDVSGLIDELRRDASEANAGGAQYAQGQTGPAPYAAPQQKKGLSTGAIVAIVVCSTILLLAIVGAVLAAVVGTAAVKTVLGGDGLVSTIIEDSDLFGESGKLTIGGDDSGFTKERSADGAYSVPAEGIDTLRIEWVSGDVKVLVESDSSEIRFCEGAERGEISDSDCLIYKLDQNALTIRFSSSRIYDDIDWDNLSSLIPPKELTVYIPASLMDSGFASFVATNVANSCEVYGVTAREAAVTTVSGDSLLSGFSSDTLKCDSVSGDVTLEGCSVRKLNMYSVSGLCEAEGEFTEAKLDSVSGELTLMPASAVDKASLDTVSGDVAITLPASYGFAVECSSVSGSVSAEGFTTIANDEYFYGDGACEIDVETVSGDIEIAVK